MKKSYLITIFFIFQYFVSFAQDNKVPFMLWDCNENNKIILSTNKFNDTIQIRFIVNVFFENQFKDIDKPIIIKSTELNRIYIKKDKEKKFSIIEYSDRNKDEFIRLLWEFTDSVANHWYKNQDYGKMINRAEYGKQIPM